MATLAVRVVEQIASIHQSIFRAYEENVSSYPIVSVELVAQPEPDHQVEHVANPPFVVFKPTWDYDGEPVAGKHACQADVPESVKSGLIVWNECDFAVQTFLPSLRKQLSSSLPGTRVQWFHAVIAPVFVFRQADAGADVPDPAHSAFHITLPGNGGEYIVDFTIGQYGYGMERWFLSFEEYKAMIRDRLWYICDDEGRGESLQGAFDDKHLSVQRIIRELCDEFDWDTLKQMAESDRTKKSKTWSAN
ncbi:hypothetical protein DPSP01_006558 [Paraphaeosphaeria sporulosa]